MLVRESISFERGKDPKSVLGIGLLTPRTFKNSKEAAEYVFLLLPEIFKGKIPEDILYRKPIGSFFPEYYYFVITDFLEKIGHRAIKNGVEIHADWINTSLSSIRGWLPKLYDILKNEGYKI